VRVLVIGDDEVIHKTIVGLIRISGVRVYAAHDQAGRRSARPLRWPWEGGPAAADVRGCVWPEAWPTCRPLVGRRAGQRFHEEYQFEPPRGRPRRFGASLGEPARPKTVGEAPLTERRR
jgi:hypothetical protein